jgi:orotidine-5'-phosphate decarboxylase
MGADFVIVGRSIYGDKNPRDAARRQADDIAALSKGD